jgi:FKBP-type peptidyl-prolyl cis-trans isomerase 2
MYREVIVMLNKNDFIEVEYTGSLKDDNAIFDTTSEQVAKDAGIYNTGMKYGPVVICIGQKQIIPGLDSALVGKEVGKEYTISVSAEDAFGKKDAKLIQLIAINKFKKANIQPMPGLQVNIDNQVGIIRTVSGGRTLVDFNHPLSGKDVVYKIRVAKMVTDDAKKIESYVGGMLQVDASNIAIAEGKATVTLPFDLPKDVVDVFSKKVMDVIPTVKELHFVKKEVKAETKSEEKKADNKEEKKEEKKEAKKVTKKEEKIEEKKVN